MYSSYLDRFIIGCTVSFFKTVFASVDSASQMNKPSLLGMQLPQKYKENFDVSSEGPSSGVGNFQALKYRSVTDIVRPNREIVRRGEETTGHSVRPK